MTLRYKIQLSVITGAATSILFSGCSKTDAASSSSSTSVTEIAGSSVAGASNSTESGGAVALNDSVNKKSSLKSYLDKHLHLEKQAFASTSCPKLATSSCDGTNTTITMNYSTCSFGQAAAVWNGSEILTFPTGTCVTNPQGQASVSFTRTFGVGTTRTDAVGNVITLNTSTASGYSSPVSGGVNVAWTSGNRSLTINGIEYVAQSATGKELFDHTVSSGALSITGTGAGRTVAAGGTITVQHNLAKYTGTVTVAQALTFSAGCCSPTGGELTTVLSGTKSGTESLTYGPTCGSATLVDSAGTSSTITLRQCL